MRTAFDKTEYLDWLRPLILSDDKDDAETVRIHLDTCHDIVADDVVGWSEPDWRNHIQIAMWELLSDLGFTSSEINNVIDPRLVRLVWLAVIGQRELDADR